MKESYPARERAERTFATSYQTLSGFKRSVKTALDEYLLSFDRDEFVRCVRDLALSMFHHEIPKLAVTLSLEKSENQRKKISLLLQFLSQHNLVSDVQMELGFRHLFNRLPDLRLDVPNAEELLSQFVSSAVAAEYLEESVAADIARTATKLKDPNEVAKAKAAIKDLTNEYFDSENVAEVELRINEMHAPHFHHLIVKEMVSTSLDRSDREKEVGDFCCPVPC